MRLGDSLKSGSRGPIQVTDPSHGHAHMDDGTCLNRGPAFQRLVRDVHHQPLSP